MWYTASNSLAGAVDEHEVAYVIAALAEETGGKLKKRHTLKLAEAYMELHAQMPKEDKAIRRERLFGKHGIRKT